MKKSFILLVLWSFGVSLLAQNNERDSWESGRIEEFNIINSLPDVLENDLIFYGFIHGAAMPQEVEAKILKELMTKGLKYYAPEVSYSGAYFINKYLETGEVTFLKYILQSYNAPQDASIQWINKYENIYRFMNESGKELKVIGTDMERNGNLITTHLAHILGERRSGIPKIDSLAMFKNLVEEVIIWSGKPIYQLNKEFGYTPDEILYNQNAQPNYTRRFFEFYRENKQETLQVFEKDSLEVRQILDDYLLEKKGMREAFITKNFESLVLPKIAEGEKVYSNFGYAHVLQNKLNDRMYLAAILKEKSPELKIYSILTHMADSEVLDNKKYCKNGFIKRYGKKIKLASICGTETSTELDGDTKKESVRGIEDLKNTTEMGEITIVPMKEVKQDLQIKLYYLDYVDGMNPDELIFDTNSKTIDYFQALIFIRGSEANDTYEMY